MQQELTVNELLKVLKQVPKSKQDDVIIVYHYQDTVTGYVQSHQAWEEDDDHLVLILPEQFQETTMEERVAELERKAKHFSKCVDLQITLNTGNSKLITEQRKLDDIFQMGSTIALIHRMLLTVWCIYLTYRLW